MGAGSGRSRGGVHIDLGGGEVAEEEMTFGDDSDAVRQWWQSGGRWSWQSDGYADVGPGDECEVMGGNAKAGAEIAEGPRSPWGGLWVLATTVEASPSRDPERVMQLGLLPPTFRGAAHSSDQASAPFFFLPFLPPLLPETKPFVAQANLELGR